ncbi:O-antigen ligase family protein [Lichenihabitans psoromatis]|uniref:O-antigen ligase family protein n=1 Tax=Lichenihabitans psoromatis TaxID=2528642 RepID=UPI0015AEC35A|nr:O-antigen ligase family protein [Lichenihabitans psoromatis]
MHIDRAVAAASAGSAQAAPIAVRLPPLRFNYNVLIKLSFFLFVVCGAIALVEPSPYDFASFLTIGLWFLGGFRVHRFILAFLALIFVYNFGGFVALLPYLNEPDPTLFMLQSLYLAITAVFFALFFAENTLARAELCLKAYAFSTVVAAACGILGYFNIGGTEDLFSKYGRASGTFKDPNVLGSYLIMGALYFIQSLILRRTRHLLLTLSALFIVVAGIFLSFSRGSWGAFIVAALMTMVFAFHSNRDARVRRRIVVMAAVAVGVALIGIVLLLSIDSTREFFLQRASVTQEYDEGETGRFGNQLRSLPMLLDRLNGFGPLRFRLIFDLDPHNSYINSFASYGWLGGSAFLLMVGLTIFIGFRLALARSPYARIAHVYWPALFVFLMQGFQIDIDHWRHVYLMLGAVWGIETARIRWLERPAWVERPVGLRQSSGRLPSR